MQGGGRGCSADGGLPEVGGSSSLEGWIGLCQAGVRAASAAVLPLAALHHAGDLKACDY